MPTLDEVYAERNKCVCLIARMALALHMEAFIGRHRGEEWEEDWRNVIYVELPTGQVSWHIHDSELPMFDFLQHFDRVDWWDGHTTEEKYQRVTAPFGIDKDKSDYLMPEGWPFEERQKSLFGSAPLRDTQEASRKEDIEALSMEVATQYFKDHPERMQPGVEEKFDEPASRTVSEE